MNSLVALIRRHGFSVAGWGVLLLPVVNAMYLAWEEEVYRQSLQAPSALAPINAPAARGPEPFNPDAIATVLGLSAQGGWVPSAEALQLRATFVSTQGVSQALLAGAQGARFYTVGQSLPGGSVLRRIQADSVVLWRNGREERLTFKPAVQHLIPGSATTRSNPAVTSQFLQPLGESSGETQ